MIQHKVKLAACAALLWCALGGVAFAPTYYIFAVPGTGDQSATLTAEVAANPQVILMPGYYEICSPVEVPRYKHVSGVGTSVWQGVAFPGWVPAYPMFGETVAGTNGCPNGGNGSFTNGQAIFHLHDNTIIEGFAIQGQRQVSGHNQINCISGVNSVSAKITHMNLVDCYKAVDLEDAASPSGDQGTRTLGTVIEDVAVAYVESVGVDASSNGGTGVSDQRYTDVEIEVTTLNPSYGFQCNQCAGVQIAHSRIEDGDFAFHITSGQVIQIEDSHVNRMNCMLIDGYSLHILFHGNKCSGIEGTPSQTGIIWSANMTDSEFTDNLFAFNYVQAFQVNSGVIFARNCFNNNRSDFQPLYANYQTASQVLANSPCQPVGTFGLSGVAYDTGSWLPTNTTFVGAQAPGPTGGQFNLSARLTETSATGAHSAAASISSQYTLTAATTYTYIADVAPGSSGTRNGGLSVSDGTNSAFAIFNPSTCALVTSGSGGGAGAIVGTPIGFQLGNFCRLAMSFTGVGATAEPAIELDSGSTRSYAGDGTSNLLWYDNEIALGVVSPGMWGLIQ